MNQKLIGIYVLLLAAFNLQANTLTGRVTDAETGKPVVNANVYISNTLYGSSTDSSGEYIIRDIPAGMHELVISIIGYEYISKSIWMKKGTDLKLDFRLKPKIYETRTIEIEAEIPEDWFDNLEDFKKIFLGTTQNATQCNITNPYVLDFEWDKYDRLKAKARSVIIIDNYALGYREQILLQHFIWDKAEGRWSWAIKPHFEPMTTESDAQVKFWNRNRENAYLGSVYHFFSSIVHKEVREEGFSIYRVRHAGEKIPRQDMRAGIIDYDNLAKPGIVRNETVLIFKGFLLVVYLNEFYSWIRLTQDAVTLNADGYPEVENSFEVYGEWAKAGVANLLPRYLFSKNMIKK